MVNAGNYVRMLHGMTNAFEIKEYYTQNNEHYQYFNFIIYANKGVSERCLEHLHKVKVKNMFQDTSVRTIIGYMEEDRIMIVKTNFSCG